MNMKKIAKVVAVAAMVALTASNSLPHRPFC